MPYNVIVPKNTAKFCPACDRYLSDRTVTIDALIIKKGFVLLIKRTGYPYEGFWALPGGYVDKDETIEEALARETKEETGLDIIRYKLLGIYSRPGRHPKQLIAVLYEAEVKGVPKAGDDAGDLEFFPVNHLPEKIAFDHEQMIKDYLKSNGRYNR